MANERLDKVKERLTAYYTAELVILGHQEYRLGTRMFRRADLAEVRKTIHDLEVLKTQLESQAAGRGRRKAYRVIMRDV